MPSGLFVAISIHERKGFQGVVGGGIYVPPRLFVAISIHESLRDYSSLISSFMYSFVYRSLDSFPSTQSTAEGRLEYYAGVFRPPPRSIALLDRSSHANTSHERCQE